ncbi:MAG: hypothetical protein OXE78_00325 [Gammaproteobacteria bacterium]|nr:hypothetical protein [Gammaproteobacteria bacterium]MCY4358542.1 hypothetical protein [Gammaproteobacteria bacterium]
MNHEYSKKNSNHEGIWFQIKRFIIFQIKLYADASRDFILSFIAVFAFLLDVILQRKGDDSLFEGLLKIGRRTERMINLFNQHSVSEQGMDSIDGIVREMENSLRHTQDK